MYKILVSAVLVCLLGAVSAQNGPPPTVPEIDVALYLGTWYQMYCNLLVNQTFERNAYCVTANYGFVSDRVVSVYNANNDGSPTGVIDDISGLAFVVNVTDPAKLCVLLDGGSPGCGEYWIIALGPESFGDEGLYQYSIVTDSNMVTLFVLARDPAGFRADYKEEVLQFLADNGFDTPLTEPLETYQGDDCAYAPVP